MTTTPHFHLGVWRRLDGSGTDAPLQFPAHHLVTHGVVVGMTGNGKTGLLTVMVEEALQSAIPVLMIDVKGDLPNLLLAFPSFGIDHPRSKVATRWAIPSVVDAGDRLGVRTRGVAMREECHPWDHSEQIAHA